MIHPRPCFQKPLDELAPEAIRFPIKHVREDYTRGLVISPCIEWWYLGQLFVAYFSLGADELDVMAAENEIRFLAARSRGEEVH